MKKLIFALGIFIAASCTKTDKGAPAPVVIAEDPVKFTTNLDTGVFNTADTVPLNISVSSIMPSAGFLYSVVATWTDSSRQVYKLDTSLTQSSLSIYVPGLKKAGNYSISVSVNSKSTSSNNSSKTISVVNNPMARFMGYKVAANARQLGFEYWYHNNPVMSDLLINVFQKPLGTRTKYGTFFNGIVNGDFNNDGWIDVFNAGASYNGPQANFTFLIWNPTVKKFEEKNLFNDKSFSSFGGNKHTIKPFYLNDDNFIDLIIFDNGDEGIPNSPNEPVRIVLSDGKGGYDLKEISTYENDPTDPNKKEKGEMGDLNGDGILDLVVPDNMNIYIYWGIKDFPFISQTNRARFVGDFVNFGNLSNNGFGEKVPYVAGNAYTTFIRDINKDGKNDIIIGKGEEHNSNLFPMQPLVLINQGGGKFNSQSIIKLPFYYENDNINVTIQDIITEDINNDGLTDIIATNDQMYKNPNSWAPWNIYAYIQQKDGSFIIDKTICEFNINSSRKGDWKPRLFYFDYNGDGLKDISYIDGADNGELKTKTVFIRTGNKFIEADFFQFDPYATSIKPLIK